MSAYGPDNQIYVKISAVVPMGTRGGGPMNKHQSIKFNAFAYVRLVGEL